ncbi:MAG: hypothetical protein ACI8UO_005439 [Verrucomicrobiales bacterium]|jgi:hypothetical protein
MNPISRICLLALITSVAVADPKPIPGQQLLPLPEHQVSFQSDGVEKTRWHFGPEYPRPFFYPFNGPSGTSLTRMGHPGAQNHDHHRSIWFAHADIEGSNFWADGQPAQVRQKMWLAYEDGEDEAIMASLSGWFDGEGNELMEQEIVAALIPLENGETALEFQLTMRPSANRESVNLGKTNFGFLAVRMAKTISAYFGGGTISNSEGGIGEPEIFGKSARWMDYSGPVSAGEGPNRKTVIEGITYFDHPENPRYPTKWHVREDGWMGASFGMDEPFVIKKDEPLVLRYLLHAHGGAYDPEKASTVAEEFGKRPGFELGKPEKHGQFEVHRAKAGP